LVPANVNSKSLKFQQWRAAGAGGSQRAAAMWRTSWLSREVIVLPAFIAAVFAYGVAHHYAWNATSSVGALATLLCIALFVCTGMIYACLKFLQEWHTPLTLINLFLLVWSGLAGGMPLLLVSAFIVQYLGLLAERWFFFAQARHPRTSTTK
jgi:DMSO reductase anchor subunit